MTPFIRAVLLQYTGIIGAGIFALPYVMAISNFWLASLFLVFVGIVMYLVNRFYCQIILKTKGDHQLSGYADIYLNKNFAWLSALNIFLLSVGALAAYVKLAARIIGNPWIFIVVLLIFFLLKVKILTLISRPLPLIIFFLTLLLFSFSIQYQSFALPVTSFRFYFFGTMVFALCGFTVIPEVEQVLRPKYRQLLITASFWGLVLALITNFLFALSINLLSGPHLTSDSFTGLALVSPVLASILGFIILISVFTASLNFLEIIKELFYRDLKMSTRNSYILSSIFPLSGFVLGSLPFGSIVSITGSVTVFISALIICLIRLRLHYSRSVVIQSIIIIFVLFLGLISEFFPNLIGS